MVARLEKRSEWEMRRWLASERSYNTFVTVTLKQAIPNERGGLTMLTDEICNATAWILRDRLTKAVLGNRRYRHGERVVFVPFKEDGKGLKRHHLHIALVRPADIDAPTFHQKVITVARGLDWVHREVDVRPVEVIHDSSSRIVDYCLKEGLDAFYPEGASL